MSVHRTRLHWRSVGLTLAALAVLGMVAAAAVVGLGLYNVSARLGHLPGVDWVLHTTFRNSVAFWSGDAEPPEDLRSPGMVALGAGHYDLACRQCHASPGAGQTATVAQMTPRPPHISEAVRDWTPQELHWLVHEGAKMTGMPGWPSRREDDVWPVVAFLLEVEGMTAADYGALTERPGGDACAMCHGQDGVSGNPHVPRLDILSQAYIADSLAAYRDGHRGSGIMRQAMSMVPAEAIPGLAERFARTEPGGPATSATAGPDTHGQTDRGRSLAFAEGTGSEVPACRACHGPWPEPINPAFPSLAGQYAPYLRTQLILWREELRGGGAAAELMHHASRNLTDADIEALASYYASLPPAELNDTGGTQ